MNGKRMNNVSARKKTDQGFTNEVKLFSTEKKNSYVKYGNNKTG